VTDTHPRLRLYNTFTRSKDDFVPIDPGNVRMYVCGPTVYDDAHIGNARPVIVFDLLYRLLRHLYGPEHVAYVRNITDVDDKINARAARDFPGMPLNEAIRKVTEATSARFQKDVKALGCLEPDHQPRATEHIAEMRAMIERLVAEGVAYVAADHVLFSPSAMETKMGLRYGRLSRRPLEEMLAGARVDVASYKRDEMDFVLWKPSKPGEPGWPSPAGIAVPGRPGWHIECSAMSMAKLLVPFGGGLECDDPSKNVFDIHGGGIDLVFPHHENEIAQSCTALHTERMANVWMHNGFLQVEGRKMAKSEGNFVTVNELLNTEKFGGRRWPGEVLRLAMLMAHYREPIDFSRRKLEEAENILAKWREAIGAATPWAMWHQPPEEVIAPLLDDLNSVAAVMAAHRFAEEGRGDTLAAAAAFLGVLPGGLQQIADLGEDEGQREIGRHTGNGALPDLRSLLLALSGRDPAAIGKAIERRLAFIRDKNWIEADRIRNALLAEGIQLKDGKDPLTGERVTTWEVKR
jgi:cysteinyl-tRNA synthetase